MARSNPPSDAPDVGVAGAIFQIDGHRVMLDADVARAFGTETRRVNEAVSRNPEKFSHAHAFRLSKQQAASLRSQLATTKPSGRGGSQYAPRVFTVQGVARLATILNTPEALRATDLIIETFIDVHRQLADGRKRLAIPNADAFEATPEDRQATGKLRKRMMKALGGLLDSLVDVAGTPDPNEAAKTIGGNAFANVVERLRTQGLENNKLEADTALVLAQAEEVLAKARKADAEAKSVDLDNLDRKIGMVRKLIDLARDLEPAAFIDTLETFKAEPLARISGPKPRNR